MKLGAARVPGDPNMKNQNQLQPPRRRVLIVDDDPNEIVRVTLCLIQKRYEIAPGYCAKDARDALTGHPFDAVLLDMKLPDGDGLDLLQEIKEAWPRTGVVILSAHGTEATRDEALRRGAFDFVDKPWAEDHLLTRVANACEQTRLAEDCVRLGGERPIRKPSASPAAGKARESAAAPGKRVLIVDDEALDRELLTLLLTPEGYATTSLESAAELREALAGEPFDAVLLDMRLPDSDGLDLLRDIKKQWPGTEVIVLSGHGDEVTRDEALKRGAFDFVDKPWVRDHLLKRLDNACNQKRTEEARDRLARTECVALGEKEFWFTSHLMKQIRRFVERIASSEAAVLVTGESGTGKELVVDLIHEHSRRRGGPNVKINCAALPRELIEAELFGSEKGAYTGAVGAREGLFGKAKGGSILLDEISEMPSDTQTKLLRVLQEKEYRPVGSNKVLKADCRIVAATNRVPEQAIREGKLREDLYYRISALHVHLPPLRERREDILPLAQVFLNRFATGTKWPKRRLTPEAEELILRYHWPGNVRQLENEMQRAVLVSESAVIRPSDFSIRPQLESSGNGQFGGLGEAERKAIIEALQHTAGNKAAAARRLGVTRQTLYNKLKLYALDGHAGRPTGLTQPLNWN